jgi:hypothetical protein
MQPRVEDGAAGHIAITRQDTQHTLATVRRITQQVETQVFLPAGKQFQHFVGQLRLAAIGLAELLGLLLEEKCFCRIAPAATIICVIVRRRAKIQPVTNVSQVSKEGAVITGERDCQTTSNEVTSSI